MTPHTLFADDQICKQCHVLFLQINLRQDLLLKKTNKNFSSCLILLIQQDTTLGKEDRAERMLSMCRVPRVRCVCLQQSLQHPRFPLWRGGLCLSALLSMGSRWDPTCGSSQPLSYSGFQVFLVQLYFSLRLLST